MIVIGRIERALGGWSAIKQGDAYLSKLRSLGILALKPAKRSKSADPLQLAFSLA
jgi:hypothetical protein